MWTRFVYFVLIAPVAIGCAAPPATDAGLDAPDVAADTSSALDSVTDASDASPPDTGPALPNGVSALSTTDLEPGLGDLEPLGRLVGGAQMVGIGESIHTSGGYLRMRTRLIRYLVEQRGFRVVGIEATRTPTATATEPYVQTCTGTPEAATGQALNPIWWDRSTPALLQWLCAWNRDHATDRVHVFGFDIRQPWIDAPAIDAYLTRVAPADAPALSAGLATCLGVRFASEQAFFMDPTVQAYYEATRPMPAADHSACVTGTTALAAYLAEHHDALVAAGSEREFQLARLAGVDIAGFDGSIYYVSRNDLARANPPRDDAMADVIRTIRGLDYPRARTILWAHNGHIMTRSNTSPGGQWTNVRNMATQLAEADPSLGYLAIGQFSYVTHYNWFQGPMVLAMPAEDTLEYTLEQVHVPLMLVDTAAATAGNAPLIDPTLSYGAGFDVQYPGRNYQAVIFHHESVGADYFTARSPWGF